MAQIMLDRPCVLSIVGEFVAGGVAQHVRVYRELDAGPLSGPPDDLPHRVGGERRLALAGLGGLTLTSILRSALRFPTGILVQVTRAREYRDTGHVQVSDT